MSRRHTAEKRIVLPDAKFGDKVVAKFINNVMEHGKKAVAEKIVGEWYIRKDEALENGVVHEVITDISSLF